MPTLHEEAGFAFRFRAVDRSEPPHVHVSGHDGFAKIWLVPAVELQDSRGYSRRQVDRILKITEAHRTEWLAAWRRYFGRA